MKNKLIATLVTFIALNTSANEIQSTHDFLFSDFGSINKHSLETHTMPKSVALTALVLEGRKMAWIPKDSLDYRAVLGRLGFITPSEVSNAPAGSQLSFQNLPLGLTEKQVKLGLPMMTITGLNVTCASCHAGRLYDRKGTPTNKVWMGLPNTSVNMDLYTNTIYNGLKLVNEDFEAAHALMKKIAPETSLKERAILKLFVYRTVNKKINHLEKTIDQALPFSNGGPGITNGVAALKFTLNLFDRSTLQPEYGFTSIPALGDRFLRSSLLYDGVYSPLGTERFKAMSTWTAQDEKAISDIVAAFTIPTMGQSFAGVLKNLSSVQQVMHDIIGKYEAPQFPGDIDFAKAARGSAVYSQNCAQCHGTYEWKDNKVRLVLFPNKLVPQAEMNTDPQRWKTITPTAVKGLQDAGLSQIMSIARAEGYVAPLLNSLWATAPYLHNASVPTLWDLMNPEQRPANFMVGGHSLDFKKVGIKLETNTVGGIATYPKDVQPWSAPAVYHTSEIGRSNKGHEAPFDRLNPAEKLDLLEFLKML
jgi:mono/diheme cytochrome c family protein